MCVRETDVAQEAVRRTPFELGEDASEMEDAHPGIARQRRERERLGEARLDERLGAVDAGGIPRETLGTKERLALHAARERPDELAGERLGARLVARRAGVERAPKIGLEMLGLAVGLFVTIVAAFSSRPAASATIDQEVLTAREAAWRGYFAGDVKVLGDLLPPDFIGIGWVDGPFSTRDRTLEGARSFREQGGRLVRLAFPETQAQRFGDVVVLYGRYEVVIFSEGAERTFRGRLTEMFVRRDGKWLHPGWHLDAATAPAGSDDPR